MIPKTESHSKPFPSPGSLLRQVQGTYCTPAPCSGALQEQREFEADASLKQSHDTSDRIFKTAWLSLIAVSVG